MTMLAIEPQHSNDHWARIAARAPMLAGTCQDYVAQISVTMRPSTTKSVDSALRIFSDWLIDHDPNVRTFAQINRRHIDAFKLWLATRRNQRGEPLNKSTIRHRLSMLRVVFLDDEDAAKFMAAAVRLNPQRRLVVEMLARTGLRVTEFCELTHDAIITMNQTNWLRVPVGKLRTDR